MEIDLDKIKLYKIGTLCYVATYQKVVLFVLDPHIARNDSEAKIMIQNSISAARANPELAAYLAVMYQDEFIDEMMLLDNAEKKCNCNKKHYSITEAKEEGCPAADGLIFTLNGWYRR